MKSEFKAKPFNVEFCLEKTALIMIDFQYDFVEKGGFGELLGNDVTKLQACVKPAKEVLKMAREKGLLVIHTREGHDPSLNDCPPYKLTRGGQTFIGTEGPYGRILVRGSKGHDIIDDVYPIKDEVVLDKPGKGAFFATDLNLILQNRGIEALIICGVTTEVCVNTTAREANDRGYKVIIPEDCVASYFDEFQKAALEMIVAQGAIVGCISQSEDIINGLKNAN